MDVNKHVLIIEDDVEQAKLLASFLRQRGYQVTHAELGKPALEIKRDFQFILLDLNLPDTDGISLFRPLKDLHPAAYIIMLTARKEEVDRVLGLEVGADDYITKPYSLRELEARLRAIQRRDNRAQIHAEGTSRLNLDLDTCQASLDGHRIEFTAQEFKVLFQLFQRPKRIFTRDQIIQTCWGEDVYVTDRVVDAMIARIRKKLKSAFGKPYIFTKHGLGYGFDDEG